MTWVGGAILLSIVSARVDRSRDATFRLQFSRAASVVGPVVGTAALILLGAGIAMVGINDAWRLSQTWIWLALVLFAISMAIGAGYFSRVDKRIAAALETNDVPEADRLTRQMTLVSRIDLLLLLVVVWLMVAKPGT